MEMEITFDFRMHPIVGAKTRFRNPSDRASRLQESRQTMPLIWNPWLDRQKNLKRLKKLRFFLEMLSINLRTMSTFHKWNGDL